MVVSPKEKKMFLVDVKGLYRRNPWLIKRKPLRDNLFYVLTFVPVGDVNRYFTLSQHEVHSLIASELARLNRADNYPVTGFNYKLAEPHENAWEVLPA
jgi:hypothetical protein